MASYLVFTSEKSATDASRADWANVLGRPKRAEDITEFLWGVTVNPKDPTKVIGVVSDDALPLLPEARKTACVSANTKAVKDTLAEMATIDMLA